MLTSVGDVEIPKFVDERHITGVEPSFRVQRFSRSLGIVDVALHHVGALGQEEADHASGEFLPRLGVDNADVRYGDGLAAGARLDMSGDPKSRRQATHFVHIFGTGKARVEAIGLGHAPSSRTSSQI